MILLILLLGWFFFCIALLLLPGRTAQRYRLRSLEGSTESGGDQSGVREPRFPSTPYWPSQAAAAVIPEDVEVLQKPGSSVGHSNSAQEPLRLQDGLA